MFLNYQKSFKELQSPQQKDYPQVKVTTFLNKFTFILEMPECVINRHEKKKVTKKCPHEINWQPPKVNKNKRKKKKCWN
jgi:hypothetical protein